MKTKIILITLILLCKFALTQNNCFNIVNLPDLPKGFTHEDTIKRDSLFFETTIKNCKAPNFKSTTIDGKQIELEKLNGKVVVLNFWFKECAPCIAEMPGLNKLVDEYSSKNIVFISLSRNDTTEINNDFFSQHPLKFEIIPNCVKIAADYIILGWPTTYVLDKKGRVKALINGGRIDETAGDVIYNKIKSVIDELL